MALQGPLDTHLDGGPLFPFPPLRGYLIQARRTTRGGVRLLQPFVKQRLEFAHVFKAQLKRLEPADGRLREHVTVERAQSQPHVRLRKTQLDPALLELLGKLLQVVRGRRVLVRVLVVSLMKALRVAVLAEVRAVVVLVRVPEGVMVHPLLAVAGLRVNHALSV